MYHKTVPADWSSILAFMLSKKGNMTNADNYRCISLINSVTKIFTNIFNNRVYSWAKENGVLPEFQAGYRRNRSCLDYVFTLNTKYLYDFFRSVWLLKYLSKGQNIKICFYFWHMFFTNINTFFLNISVKTWFKNVHFRVKN